MSLDPTHDRILKRSGARWFPSALLLLALALQGPFLALNTRNLADDAMISARYARNWAAGAGLAYNRGPGEQPVEGYSNFLWVCLLAAGAALHLHPRLVTALAGGACALLATVLLGGWTARVTGRKLIGLAAALTLALSLPFDLWAVQGLETPLFALLLLAVAAGLDPERPRPWPWLLALLAALTRPDGLLAALALAAAEIHRPAAQRRRALLLSLYFILPFAAYTLWRFLLFGALLPNVFYAKTGLGAAGARAGGYYLLGFAREQGLMAALLLAGAYTALKRRRDPAVLYAAVLLAAYLVFIVAVGGDFMPDYRFLMHVLPLAVGLGAMAAAPMRTPAAAAAGRAGGPGKTAAVSAAGLAALAIVSFGLFARSYYAEPAPFPREWHRDQALWYGRAASWLLLHAPRQATIAAGDIGYIGWVTDADRIVDVNGLVDRHLASLPGAAAFRTDADYVFGRRPDFIVAMVHYFPGGAVLGHGAFDRAALADPRLRAQYRLAAELPGWRAESAAWLPDGGEPSAVRFRIYARGGR